jgi:RNA polymerase sigma-70 factor (ECF subfamily)
LSRSSGTLSGTFRIVFVAKSRNLSVEETAGFLGLPQATVKTRLRRARRPLRQALDEQLAPVLADAFPFDVMRCAKMADRVLERLGLSSPSAG